MAKRRTAVQRKRPRTIEKRRSRRSQTSRRGHPSKTRASHRLSSPKTADQLFARSEQFQETWTSALRVVSAMRAGGVSLTHALQDSGVSRATFTQLAGSALRKRSNGRYVAKASDTLLRVMVIPTADGLTEVALRNSRDATTVGEYLNAVHRYLARGDSSQLERFRSTRITVSRRKVSLLTDLPSLDRLAGAGELSFESVYART